MELQGTLLLVTIIDTGSAQGIRDEPVDLDQVAGGTITATPQTSMVPTNVLVLLLTAMVYLGAPLVVTSNSLK